MTPGAAELSAPGSGSRPNGSGQASLLTAGKGRSRFGEAPVRKLKMAGLLRGPEPGRDRRGWPRGLFRDALTSDSGALFFAPSSV